MGVEGFFSGCRFLRLFFGFIEAVGHDERSIFGWIDKDVPRVAVST